MYRVQVWPHPPPKQMSIWEKRTNHVFVFILLSHTLYWTSERNYFIYGIYTNFLFSISFSHIHDCQKSGKKSIFSKSFNFLWTQLDGEFSGFPPAGPKTKVDPSDVNSGVLKILPKKMSKLCVFSRHYLYFSKSLCVLPSTLCTTGELWPRPFIWRKDIRVTHF